MQNRVWDSLRFCKAFVTGCLCFVVLFSIIQNAARSDLPFQLCWLATNGTQESYRTEYQHL